VTIPATEGRAGMTKLVVDGNFDLATFAAHARSALPSYAVPVFLLLGESLPVTETLKYKTQDLAAAAFDPAMTRDPLFVWDARAASYVPIDTGMFDLINAGGLKL
jgi:hypothetical protein